MTRPSNYKLQQLETQFKEWVQERLDDQRPVSHRFASRLVAELADRLNVSQIQSRQYLLNWGLNQILVPEPTSLEFPGHESEMRETALWWWARRDLL